MIDLLSMKRSTLPMGNRKYGGGGDDGGYAARQAKTQTDQQLAIQAINSLFGKGDGAPIYTTSSGVAHTDVPGVVPQGDNVNDIGGNNNFGYGYDTPWTKTELTGYDTAARDKAAADRTKLYGTITQDASARLLDKLGRDREIAQRGTNFQLARQGLSGGSVDVDQGRQLLDKYNEGVLEAGNAALQAGNDARAADEKTRLGIINNVQNGLSQSDAISSSFAGLENNAAAARDAAMATNIGGFFDDINAANQARQYNQALQSTKSQYGGGGVTTAATSGGSNGRVIKY